GNTAELRLRAARVLDFVGMEGDRDRLAGLAAQRHIDAGPAALGARPAQLDGLLALRTVQHPLGRPEEEVVVVGVDVVRKGLALGHVADKALARFRRPDAQDQSARVENDLDLAARIALLVLRHACSPVMRSTTGKTAGPSVASSYCPKG